jgi:SWI/SNF-related matrix-associated actin-dependent regulator 1 of chromatin subfamily A
MRQLYPYQEAAVQQIKEALLNRWLLSFEMGTGKTPTAIIAAKELRKQRILVVCPAIVRDNWLREFDDWWPDHPRVAAITLGRTRTKGVSKKQQELRDEAYAAPIQIVSYDLLDQVALSPWDLVVFDEIHRCKNAGSKQSHAAATICLENPRAAILGLSGTLIPDSVGDLWAQLNLLWPGRFGKPDKNGRHSFQFRDRYTNKRNNGYGWDFEGVKEQNLPELKKRLAAVSTRVTRAEVAHLLPPFQVQLLRQKPASLEEQLALAKANDVETAIIKAGQEKIGPACEWVSDAFDSGTTHVALLTHLRESASTLADKLRQEYRDVAVYCITGDQTPEDRNKELAKARAEKKAVVVATMHSIGIGIDLTWCTQALFVELYWRLETILQAIGRFSRLSGKVPSSVSLMVLAGTLDEAVAQAVLGKVASANSVIGAGDGESKLEAALSDDSADQEAFLQSLTAFATTCVAESSDLL